MREPTREEWRDWAAIEKPEPRPVFDFGSIFLSLFSPQTQEAAMRQAYLMQGFANQQMHCDCCGRNSSLASALGLGGIFVGGIFG